MKGKVLYKVYRIIFSLWICFSISLFTSCGQTTKVAGTDTETGGAVAGIIKDENGPVAGAIVTLYDKDFNPATTQVRASHRVASNPQGKFLIKAGIAGGYNIEVFLPKQNTWGLSREIVVPVHKDTVITVPDIKLEAPSSLLLNLEELSLENGGVVYIPGTGISKNISTSDISQGKLNLINIPAGTYSSVKYLNPDHTTEMNILGQPFISYPGESIGQGPYVFWSRQTKIRINTTSSGADLSTDVHDFPLLVRLNPSQPQSHTNFALSQHNGEDLRFTKSDGITPVPYEIDRWDSANGLAEIWVKMDTVYGNSNSQFIIMYTGKADALPRSTGLAVFDTALGFTGVWHLGENAASSKIKDALNRHPGNYTAGMSNVNTLTSSVNGIIGEAIHFDGNNQWVNLGINKPFASGATSLTLSAWVKVESLLKSRVIMAFSQSDSNQDQFNSRAQLQVNQNLLFEIGGRSSDLDTLQFVAGTTIPSQNSWYYVVGIINFAQDSVSLFVNGSLQSARKVLFTQPQSDSFYSPRNAIGAEDSGSNGFFRGVIDEAQVSKTERSPAWIKMSYENQKPGSGIVTFE